MHSILSWDFSSTSRKITNIAPQERKDAKTRLAVGLGVGRFVLIGGIGLICLGLWQKWKKNEEDHELDKYMKGDLGKEMGPRKYSYAELANAAN